MFRYFKQSFQFLCELFEDDENDSLIAKLSRRYNIHSLHILLALSLCWFVFHVSTTGSITWFSFFLFIMVGIFIIIAIGIKVYFDIVFWLWERKQMREEQLKEGSDE